MFHNQRTRKCKPTTPYPKGASRLRIALWHFKFGLESRIPLCCVTWWVWRTYKQASTLALTAGCCLGDEYSWWHNPLCPANYVHCPVCAKLYHRESKRSGALG